MVRGVEIDGADVIVTIALTVGCPLRSSFEEQVAAHVGSLPGVSSVALRFDVMMPDERAALTTRLRGGVDARDPAVARPTRDCRRPGKGGVGSRR
jgi:ATP-binding protein involved in chromosome partitioning